MPYMAPETLTKSRSHSYQSDYWSLGILAFELLFNSVPFSRHCPARFIYYAGNQYQCLWDKLLLLQSLEHSQRDVSWSIQTRNSLSPFHNFTELDESLTTQERVASYPFPEIDHLLVPPPPFPLIRPLQADSLESLNLAIPIPRFTSRGFAISHDCSSFLSSLLDVRIPQRLGQLSDFDLFSNHLWFQKFGYHRQDEDPAAAATAAAAAAHLIRFKTTPSLTRGKEHTAVSPFQPTPPVVKKLRDTDLMTPIPSSNLPIEVQKRLQEFEYQSQPNSSSWVTSLSRKSPKKVYRTSSIRPSFDQIEEMA
jgi:serine/threonine protein kinase